jgi:hypothetical protein
VITEAFVTNERVEGLFTLNVKCYTIRTDITSRQVKVLMECPLSESGRKPDPQGEYSGAVT